MCDPGPDQFPILLIQRGFYAVFLGNLRFHCGCSVAGLLSYVVVALDCGGCRCLCYIWADARLTLVLSSTS